jgi:DNA polymerase-3 subunit chi
MTRIDFHSNVGDSLLYACRLARKAYLAGQPTIVLAEPPRLRAFDEQLWTFSPLDFVPHCYADSPLAAQTPIVLTANVDHAPHYQVLLNLGAEVPAQFARFERLLEVVGNAQDELSAGRERYRFYRDRGYALNNYKQGG